MDVIDIPGIRFQGRSLTIESFEHSKDDADAAREVRELLLKDKRTSDDETRQYFRWIKINGKWEYII